MARNRTWTKSHLGKQAKTSWELWPQNRDGTWLFGVREGQQRSSKVTREQERSSIRNWLTSDLWSVPHAKANITGSPGASGRLRLDKVVNIWLVNTESSQCWWPSTGLGFYSLISARTSTSSALSLTYSYTARPPAGHVTIEQAACKCNTPP